MALRNAQQTSATDYYDYEHIESLVNKGIGWRTIGKHYPEKHWGSVRRFFKSETNRRSEQSKIKKIQKHNTKLSKKPKRQKIPTYGRIEPTHYKSGLEFHEWRIKYCKRKPTWDLDYIRDITDIYFQAINEYISIMPGVPRDYGKSFTGIDFLAYIICEYYYTALGITSGGGSTRRFYTEVKKIITCDLVREDYGDIIAYTNRTNHEIWLHDELRDSNDIDPNLRVTGRGGDVIGGHPTIVFCEDFVQEPYKSNESEDGMRDWFSGVVVMMNAPITGTFTRKSPDDIYGWMEQTHDIELYTKAALLKEGTYPTRSDFEHRKAQHPKLLERGKTKKVKRLMVREDYDLSGFTMLQCPNYDIHSLLRRRGFSPSTIRAFESEMMQRPLPLDGLVFHRDWYREVNPFSTKTDAKFMYVDPSFGRKSKTNDFFCLMVGIVRASKLYIIDCFVERNMGFISSIHKIRDYAQKHNVTTTGIEANFMQIWVAEAAQKIIPNVKPINNTVNKIERISALDDPLSQEGIYFFADIPGKTEIIKQMMLFDRKDSTPTKKDDCLDTLSGLWGMVRWNTRTYTNLLDVF